jgi:MFS transporter, DHA2 family, methylenomycin A resistance protein
MFAGLVIAAAGCAMLTGIDHHTTYLAILPGQLLIRLGIGLAVPAITTGTLAAVPSVRSGVASGALMPCGKPAVLLAWRCSEP